ncbi:hypothetical protein LCGC14_0549440 [marine sediment metagenome]|uniref:Uncharacterized protein n=1 Tax=marine sediment metagenome TaxID=412755 RepID=A0A0F9UYK0_9ZZZZ
METETKPPTKMGKKELKDALIDLGYDEKELLDEQGKCLQRPVLLEKYQAHKQGEKGLAVFSETEECDSSEEDVGIEVKPDVKENDDTNESGSELEPESEECEFLNINDPGWTQFVLGKFLEDEMDGKNPRVEGLRRVAGELIGELIEEGCDLIAAPTEENRFRACVKAWGVFITHEGRQIRFEALADANSENCFEDFATYLVAMADTRAKGRMYRNALRLKRVVAAEEVSKTVAMASEVQQGGAIHAGQISMIRLLSDRHNFNIAEVLENLGIKCELNEKTGDVNLKLLSYEDALATAKSMRELKEEKERVSK